MTYMYIKSNNDHSKCKKSITESKKMNYAKIFYIMLKITF